MLDQEFKYYIDNQEDLVKKYRNKYIVIKANNVIGVFDDEITAFKETQKQHALGTFLIQLCQEGKENYTQTFHSLAVFE